MPANLGEIEDLLRGSYADAAGTVSETDIPAAPPAAATPVRWHTSRRGRRLIPLAAAAAVLAVVLAVTVIPDALRAGSRHSSQSTTGRGAAGQSHFAYVDTGEDTVVPINLATGAALAPISLGVPGGPSGMVLAPNGKTLYVATVRGQLVPVDIASRAAEPPIRLGGVTHGLLMTPNGRTAYALQPPYGVAVVSLSGRAMIGFIRVHDASDFLMTPNGQTVYVLGASANNATLTLTPIDTATSSPRAPIVLGPRATVPSPLTAMGVTADGKTVYVQTSSTKAPLSSTAVIVPVDTATNTMGSPIRTGVAADGIVLAPNGKTAYLISFKSLIPVDLRTGKVLAAIHLPLPKGAFPIDLFASSSHSSIMFVLLASGNPGTVVPINTTTNGALRLIQLTRHDWQAAEIAFGPTGKTVYVLSDYALSNGWIPETLMTPVQAAAGIVGRSITIPGVAMDLVFAP